MARHVEANGRSARRCRPDLCRPEAVRDHPRLGRDDKVKLLRQWDYALRELRLAAEENMAGTGCNAELQRRVRDRLNALRGTDDPEPAGVSKHGG